MSPFVAYHSTVYRHRNSIRERGLLPGVPANARPFGVYVFTPHDGHPTLLRGRRLVWGASPTGDLWEVEYIGPMSEDRYVTNGFVLHNYVPPRHLSLITHITLGN